MYSYQLEQIFLIEITPMFKVQIVEKHLRHYNVKTDSMVIAKLQQIVVHCT